MEHFLSCDWGTSSFRLRLIEANSLKVIAAIRSKEGIADTYRSWWGQKAVVEREAFYMRIIKDQINALNQQDDVQRSGISLSGIPVVLSGMASSTIGLVDIPYKVLPFALDGSDLTIRKLGGQFDNSVIIISGACTENDVMRGEETKVLGCKHYLTCIDQNLQLLMPGTHPKHIVIKDQQIRGFKTYMTGEFFDLLAGQSVLSGSVQAGGDLKDPICGQHFKEGLEAAQQGNILHSSFLVRSRQVLHQVPAPYNYYYLSGLLIGTELKEVNKMFPVYLVSAGLHTALYENACAVLGISIAQIIDADEALIRGQQVVLRKVVLLI